MGMPRTNTEPCAARRDHVLPDLDALVAVHVLHGEVAGHAAGDDALGAAGHDHGVDVALLVGDERHLGGVPVHAW